MASGDRLPLVGADDIQRWIDWFGSHGRRAIFSAGWCPASAA